MKLELNAVLKHTIKEHQITTDRRVSHTCQQQKTTLKEHKYYITLFQKLRLRKKNWEVVQLSEPNRKEKVSRWRAEAKRKKDRERKRKEK